MISDETKNELLNWVEKSRKICGVKKTRDMLFSVLTKEREE